MTQMKTSMAWPALKGTAIGSVTSARDLRIIPAHASSRETVSGLTICLGNSENGSRADEIRLKIQEIIKYYRISDFKVVLFHAV